MEDLEYSCNEFYNTKKSYCFDERDFVKFIKSKYGRDSIKYIQIVGKCNAGEFNEGLERFEDIIQDEYKNSKWINF